MTTYNTGNPIGSTDPRDLYDNAQNLDTAMHTAATTWADRLGNSRPSWAGATGYQSLGDYAAGIQVTTYNQVIRASGEYWRAAAGTVLPYTTTGAGMPESGKFVSVGDAMLRADLVDGDGSSLVGFQQSGTGSVLRTAQDKMREVVTPEDFGAAGTGLVNDRDAVYNALYFACSTGTRFMGGGGGKTYRIDSSISIDRSGMPPVIIDWNGSNVICNNVGITFTGSPSFLTTSLAVEPVRGDMKLSLSSVVGIQQGDLIEIESPALTQGAINTLHYYLAAELDGNDVYIEGNVVADINAQQIVDSGKTGSIVVRVYRLNKQITISNGNFTVIDANGAVVALLVRNNYRAVVDNMTFDGHCRNQVYMMYNGHDLVSRIRVRDFGYINKDMGYSNLPAGANTVGNPVTNSPSTGDAGLSYGYGIIHARSYSSVVRDVVGGHGWHVTDAARGQMHIIYENVISSRNGFGCSTHEGAWHVTWRNCDFRGNRGITAGRCAFPTIEGCKFTDTRVHGAVFGSYNLEVVIRNNIFDIQNAAYTVATSGVYNDSLDGGPGPGSKSAGYERLFLMEGNTFIGHHLNRVGFKPEMNKAGKLIVRNNNFIKSSLSDIRCATYTAIENNIFHVVSGQFAVVVHEVDTDVTLSIAGNREIGGFTEASPSLISLNGAGSPASSSFKGNDTTSTLLRFTHAVTIDLVSENSARGRILQGNNTQTVKNKINNIQGVVDYQVAVTTAVNNTTMTL